MIKFHFPIDQPDANELRRAANNVNVSFDPTNILFLADGKVAYQNMPSDFDTSDLEAELESEIGLKPKVDK